MQGLLSPVLDGECMLSWCYHTDLSVPLALPIYLLWAGGQGMPGNVRADSHSPASQLARDTRVPLCVPLKTRWRLLLFTLLSCSPIPLHLTFNTLNISPVSHKTTAFHKKTGFWKRIVRLALNLNVLWNLNKEGELKRTKRPLRGAQPQPLSVVLMRDVVASVAFPIHANRRPVLCAALSRWSPLWTLYQHEVAEHSDALYLSAATYAAEQTCWSHFSQAFSRADPQPLNPPWPSFQCPCWQMPGNSKKT